MTWRAGLKTVLSLALLGSVGWMAGAMILGSRPSEAQPSHARPPPPPPRIVAEDVLADDRLIVPVQGVRREALTDTWGQSREGGRRAHEAIDIVAPRGTPVLAAASGMVEKLFVSVRGGTTVYVRSPDRRRIYYYAHLDGYAPGLTERQQVRAGDMLGYVGSTGDTAPDAPHLHFAISLARPDEGWWQGVPINRYPYLRR